MRIAFVTSGLEPGRNGVGDYTTLLAGECERAGHATCRIALNDREADGANQLGSELRLASTLPWTTRAERAHRFLHEFAPEFVSLQFVCYGFHPRGFVQNVSRHLLDAIRDWPAHVFFHELWVGEEYGSSLKDRLLGWWQRRGVLSFLSALAPKVIHTSNAAYVQRLAARGVSARRLPLFGSLPLPSPGIRPDREKLTFVFFGTLHPVWPTEPLFSRLRMLARPLALIHVGNIGAGAALWDELALRYPDFEFHRLGELAPQRIADVFAASDFAVATTPWALIGKSASVAAMLDLGLPVIVNRDDVHYPNLPCEPPTDSLLLRMSDDLPAVLRTASRREPKPRLPEVAEQFLSDLR